MDARVNAKMKLYLYVNKPYNILIYSRRKSFCRKLSHYHKNRRNTNSIAIISGICRTIQFSSITILFCCGTIQFPCRSMHRVYINSENHLRKIVYLLQCYIPYDIFLPIVVPRKCEKLSLLGSHS